MSPPELYQELAETIRGRFDVIRTLRTEILSDFAAAETAAFHGRKIVEGIAFGCLIGLENGIKVVPKDAKGKWNAETILNDLLKKNIAIFPSPSTIRDATQEEQDQYGAKVTIEGIPDRRLTRIELIKIYQRLHRWLHELNPYTVHDHQAFGAAHGKQLWQDLSDLELLVKEHVMSISGEGFFCILWDKNDGKTKVISITKVGEL